MRQTAAIVLACGAIASIAYATGSLANLNENVRNTLTTIDTIPTKTQLDHAFANEPQGALTSLSEIAQDTEQDVGVRMRAAHALAKYCPAPCDSDELAYQSLRALIDDTRNETIGEPVVLLRAAVETIGVLQLEAQHSNEVTDLLIGLLDHPSRDIRAGTARALRDLCNTRAVVPLRVRYTSEPTDQVKLAISEALRILGQCTP